MKSTVNIMNYVKMNSSSTKFPSKKAYGNTSCKKFDSNKKEIQKKRDEELKKKILGVVAEDPDLPLEKMRDSKEKLEKIKSKLTIIKNETTFKGVNEFLEYNSTDLLCVFRRKRGFFKKLWEKNTILKEEFYCEVPLLVLNGLK